MGRSVNVPSNNAGVLYFSVEDEDGDFFYDFISNLRDIVHSVDGENNRFYTASSNEWIGKEGRVISKCSIALIVLSEYCGLCSLAVVPQEGVDDDAWEAVQKCWEAFSTEWSSDFFERLRAKLLAEGWELYGKTGTFSNGEGVYSRVS